MVFKETPSSCDFIELRQRLFEQLENDNFGANTINTYRKMANVLDTFLAENNITFYNSEIGDAFLTKCKKYRGFKQKSVFRQPDMMRKMIHRLNCLLDGTKIKRFSTSKYSCPDCFKDEFVGYIEFQSNSGKKEKTVTARISGCIQFLIFLEKMGLRSLSEIMPKHIYSAADGYSSKIVCGLNVPPFLVYLHQQGILASDYSGLLPSVRTKKYLPTVYEKDEIELLLSAADKTTILGKRNYAILLLAARLGMRISDIVNLTFENVDLKRKKIEFVQMKNDVPLNFPLFNEIEQAITDYLSVRPKNSIHKQIFIRGNAPYAPIGRSAITNVLTKYFRITQIKTDGKKRGPHSLRSSLASALVSENVPYSVTQKILGQVDPNAIKHYVRLDVEQLREYALSVPTPTGAFSALLGLKEVLA